MVGVGPVNDTTSPNKVCFDQMLSKFPLRYMERQNTLLLQMVSPTEQRAEILL